MQRHWNTLAGMLVLMTLASGASAGDLNPPAGAVQETNRVTLNNQAISLPHTITAPGSYVLTSNFTATGPGDGFIIDADHVTLDLNGFTLAGIPGTSSGILVNVGKQHLVIKNGVVRDWGGIGIQCNADGSRIENVVFSENGSFGMRIPNHTAVRGCSVSDNGSLGIFGENYNLIESCTVQGNGSLGIDLDNGSTVLHCSAWNNEYGIIVGLGSLVQSCDAHANQFGGIVALAGSLVIDCAANMNPLQGIDLRDGSCAINCTAIQNNEFGIRLNEPGATAINCVASLNDIAGILMLTDTFAYGNACNDNGDAGIQAPFLRAMIEGNTAIGNDIGFEVSFFNSAESLVIGNRASKNTSAGYGIQAGNAWGPIINIAGAGDISGVVGTGHLQANFEY